MGLHANYKHLLGIAYKSGVDDCYGLARRYYQDVFGITIVNAARPEGWWDDKEMNLIDQFISHDGWENMGLNTRILRVGDGLVFSLINGKANHVGCYVGNGMFIHHIMGRFSTEDALMDKWKARLLAIIRHPATTPMAGTAYPTTDMMDILPEHIHAKLKRIP
jgi:cell wall-associated NlpC family hydrolase